MTFANDRNAVDINQIKLHHVYSDLFELIGWLSGSGTPNLNITAKDLYNSLKEVMCTLAGRLHLQS